MTKIPPKPKNYQNIPDTQKITKILSKPKNDQNTSKTQKMTKIPQNLKITKIPPQTPNTPPNFWVILVVFKILKGILTIF